MPIPETKPRGNTAAASIGNYTSAANLARQRLAFPWQLLLFTQALPPIFYRFFL
jgi:hypothetical protein